MRFADWIKELEIKEVSTSTGEIAHFSRIVIGGNSRMCPEPIILDDEEKKKHVKKNNKKNL